MLAKGEGPGTGAGIVVGPLLFFPRDRQGSQLYSRLDLEEAMDVGVAFAGRGLAWWLPGLGLGLRRLPSASASASASESVVGWGEKSRGRADAARSAFARAPAYGDPFDLPGDGPF